MSVATSLISRPGNTRNEALRERSHRFDGISGGHSVTMLPTPTPPLGYRSAVELVVCRKCSIGEILSIFLNPPMTLRNPFGVVGEMTQCSNCSTGQACVSPNSVRSTGHHSTSTIMHCACGEKVRKSGEFRLVSPPAMPSQHGVRFDTKSLLPRPVTHCSPTSVADG